VHKGAMYRAYIESTSTLGHFGCHSKIQRFFNVHGSRHSQNAGLGRHFPMDAHEGGVEPSKPGRPDCVSTPTSLGDRMNEGSYPASPTEWSG
jgi:hypothetical protein